MTAAPLATLVDDYLHVLSAERGASTHTLRAYRRELHDFIEWLAGEAATLNVQAVEHTHIRSYLGTLYHRGLSKASAARHRMLGGPCRIGGIAPPNCVLTQRSGLQPCWSVFVMSYGAPPRSSAVR